MWKPRRRTNHPSDYDKRILWHLFKFRVDRVQIMLPSYDINKLQKYLIDYTFLIFISLSISGHKIHKTNAFPVYLIYYYMISSSYQKEK